jgi:hypothetical protein
MRVYFARLLGTGILILALGGSALAEGRGRGHGNGNGNGNGNGGSTPSSPSSPSAPTEAPEIDVSAGISALALLASGLVVIRGRRQVKRT